MKLWWNAQKSKSVQSTVLTYCFVSICAFLLRYFVDKKPIWVQNDSLALPGHREIDRSVAQYTGGLVQVDKKFNQIHPDTFKLVLIYSKLGGKGSVRR